jgi:RNA polymerase sigma-54 factor
MFFSAGSSLTTDKTDTTALAIKSKIKTIIDTEDKTKPLSDAKIAKLLSSEGIQIARRTIAKYRESLGIPPTTLRKKYKT